MLLSDSLGKAAPTPTDQVPQGLRPSSSIGLKYQIPNPHKGTTLPPEVQQKVKSAREGVPGFQWFPAAPPQLMPYLFSNDALGNTAVRHGALVDVAPLEPEVQGVKYWASSFGLHYDLEQTFTYAGMNNVVSGDDNLGNYNLDLPLKWAVFDAPAGGTAGWISAQIEYQAAIGNSGPTQTAQTNLGTLTNPTSFWSKHSGFRMPELAWQQALQSGEIVALVGVVNQSNYLDANAYANSGRGQFINSALGNSMVLPLPAYGYGANLQWQPRKDWYTMLGYSVGSSSPADKPRENFTWTTWSIEWEIGYAPSDFLGMGPGIYRVQPFLARVGGPVQGGLAFNGQQQLGPNSPFGWFGRFGFGGAQVSGGAKAQIGTGFDLQAPLKYVGWVPQLSNDLLGVGFVWSQPSATTQTVYHENEYVFETFYTLQLSPLSQVQPDLQLVWNPAFSPDPGPAVVFQFQFILKW
ncbi:MAG TPA: carbohydrate porin [Burkholderiales bacterium]|nr:carbohydrate porin [Burkholderiales bacterium]